MRVLLAAACMCALALSFAGSVEASGGTFGRVLSQTRLPDRLSARMAPADIVPSLVRVADAEHQRVAAAQLRLRSLGLYHGTTNGTLGPQTTAALAKYQAKLGLAVTGRLDKSTQYALTNDDLLRVCLARGFTATDCLGAIAQFYARIGEPEVAMPSAAAEPGGGQACDEAKDRPACAHAIAEMGVWLNTLPAPRTSEPASHAVPLR